MGRLLASRLWARVAVSVLLLLSGVLAYDPKNDFCRRYSHASAVVGDRLYVDGGQINLEGQGPRNYTNERLLWHDLAPQAQPAMPPLNTNLSKPSSIPSLIGGTLWADAANAKLYQFGGDYPPGLTPNNPSLWVYDIYSDNWTQTEISKDPDVAAVSFGASTVVEHLGIGYMLGGWKSEQNSFKWNGERQAINQLLEYDMVKNAWWNRTGPVDRLGRAEGAMFYVPKGDVGMLVHFGGIKTDVGGGESTATEMPLSSIDVYDIGNQKWFIQNATGDIPEPRRRFCGGIISAPDGSSHNIYINAGMGFGDNSTGYDDIYILTLPTFTWIKVYPPRGEHRDPKDAYPSYDMSCNVVKNQLIVIGGQFPADPDVHACDIAEDFGVHNVLLGKAPPDYKEYWGLYDPNLTTYRVPSEITSKIGGNEKGGATKTAPEKGFDNFNLNDLFSRTVETRARAATRTPSASATPSSSKLSTTKLIAIIVPVAVVVLAICGFLIYRCCCCRRRTKEEDRPGSTDASTQPMSLYPGHTGSIDRYASDTMTYGSKTPPLASPAPQTPVSGYAGFYEQEVVRHNYVERRLTPQELRAYTTSPVELMAEEREKAGRGYGR